MYQCVHLLNSSFQAQHDHEDAVDQLQADQVQSCSSPSTASHFETVLTPSEGGDDSNASELSSLEHEQEDWASEHSCGDSTSVPSCVYEDELMHGRRYHGFRQGLYPLPNDRLEQLREELNHAMMLELTRGHLFYADIGDHPQKIIDIGTGIGSWAIDVADRYPSASVIGTDLSAIQPRWVPVNVHMFVDDCEQPDWLHGSNFDLVHFRGMAGVLRDLDGVLATAYPHIRKGGWIEFQEIVPQIMCDDNTMAEDDALCIFYEAAVQGLQAFGCHPLRTTHLQEVLDGAGFTNIRCVVHKIPVSTWPHDKQLKTLGLFMKGVMLDSLDALAAKPLAALGIPPQDRQELVQRARASLEDWTVHRYVNCCFCYGQKKEQHVSSSELY